MANFLKKASLIFAITILCGSYAFAQNSRAVLKILSNKGPRVKWNVKSLIKGDFDYDGVEDYALRGISGGRLFVLGIVKGSANNRSKSWTLEFNEDANRQDGLCSVSKARINAEDINKAYKEFAKDYLEDEYAKRMANLPKGSKAISIYDGMCDSFNVFWDRRVKKFIWWRI